MNTQHKIGKAKNRLTRIERKLKEGVSAERMDALKKRQTVLTEEIRKK